MLHGLRTATYTVNDPGSSPGQALDRATAWYTDVLGFGPYFDEPFYVGFNVGGFELGLMPTEAGSATGPGGVTVYWGVDDADAAFARLLEKGATAHEPIQDVGGGIRLGTVLDPFGNVLGVIDNPHFEAA